MSCILEALVTCLLSTLTVSADARWQVSQPEFFWMDDHAYRGAIGDVHVAFDIPVTRSFRIKATVWGHQSFIDTNRDRGYEYSGLGFEWRPFARERSL